MLIMSFTVYGNIMTTTSKPDQLLLRFRPTDTQNGISRATVRKLAEHLGFTGETQVIHYALRKGKRRNRNASNLGAARHA